MREKAIQPVRKSLAGGRGGSGSLARVVERNKIERQNRTKLREKGLVLKYVQGWSMSWLELSVIGVAKEKQKSTAKEKDAEIDIEA